MAAKMATTVGCVTGLQQRYHPWNIPYLGKKIKGFRLKAKSFRNTATHQKIREGVPSTPPPLVPRRGCEFACMAEGEKLPGREWKLVLCMSDSRCQKKKKNSFTYFLLIFSEIISCKNFFFRVTSRQFMLLIFEAANWRFC